MTFLQSLRSTYDAVELAPPSDRTLEALARALDGSDLERLYRSCRGEVGGSVEAMALRTAISSYRSALEQASDPGKLVERLIIEARSAQHAADNADHEAAYRARCAADWLADGETEQARAYADQADFHARFAERRREESRRKLAKSQALVAGQTRMAAE